MGKLRKSTPNRSSTPRLVRKIDRPSKKAINNILELPNEILHRIFDRTSIWHHQNVRAACSRFKQISDSVIRHCFKHILNPVCDNVQYDSSQMFNRERHFKTYFQVPKAPTCMCDILNHFYRACTAGN